MIRKYKKSDFENLVDCDFNSGHPFYSDKTKKSEIRDWLKNKFKKNIEKFYVYVKDKKIIGAIGFNENFFAPNSCEITYLAVLKDYHNKGIGTELIRFIEEKARKMRYRSVYLYTGKINKNAQRFYKNKGYELYAKLLDHYSWGEDAVLFRKRIG